ncbi:gasdermin-C isoform X2 [Saimiri boliviensis]|uniref:gasdermin-C isoform X2 n=1 Tax=Saimiri boliviensis TaxID=27679 RepID=UPI00193CAE4E|nr:gasdermin-C isoform X1 [Saimiri boliviensis boliviensis]XP_039320283.1 gasdermin-C isoform X1 [Saimiri boliviensis boliviensis]
MFQRISKSLVKEVGKDDLTPVKCLTHATKLRQFAVLQKMNYSRSLFWEKCDYIPLDFSLSDILESSSSVPDNDVNGPLYFGDTMIQKCEAGIGVNVGGELSVSGEASADQGGSLGYQIVTISAPNLEGFQKRKLLHPEPKYLEECRMRKGNLYVVTDAVELISDTLLWDNRSSNLSGKISLWITSVKGQSQGKICKKKEKKLTLKKGMVMAYKKKQLIFEEKAILITDDTGQRTFQDMVFCEACTYLDFKGLQEEVSRNIEALAQLSKDVQVVVFSSILVMLREGEDLQDLMYTLKLDSSGHLDGSGSAILKILQQNSSHALSKSKEAILYLLEAIMVLSDIQHDLLACSMDKRILLQQQELVRSILEPNFRDSWSIPFTLKPELLAPLQREDLAITYGLLEECGLRMELDSLGSTWDGAVRMPLSALYGTLSLLQQLVEA